MTTKKVSRAEVAKLAKVSPQTVSRVSNNDPNVRDETRQRVLKAIRELGYYPNRAAQALKSGKFRSVGVVVFDITETGNALTLKGITQAATKAGYITSLMLLPDNRPLSITACLEEMFSLAVDAVIIVVERLPEDITNFTIPQGMNVVLVGSVETDRCPVVDANQSFGAQTAVNYLLSMGHETVYFVSGPDTSLCSSARERAWKEMLIGAGRTIPPVIRGNWDATSGYSAGEQLARDPDCSAVFVANDAMATGVIAALRDSGRRVPEDVSVVGFDDSLGSIIPKKEITTIRQNFTLIGRTAFQEVLRTVSGSYDEKTQSSHPTRTVQIPVELITRSTVIDRSNSP